MNNLENEIWKDIPNFVGVYQISSLGRLKSFKVDKDGIILSNVNKKGGYLSIVLQYNGLFRYTRIHVLVAELFIGERPSKKHHVHHINHNKQDNRFENLQYVTHKEHYDIEKIHCPQIVDGMVNYNKNIRPITILQYDLNNNFIAEYNNCRTASEKTSVCQRNIHRVAYKEEYKEGKIRKQAGGFIWKLKNNK